MVYGHAPAPQAIAKRRDALDADTQTGGCSASGSAATGQNYDDGTPAASLSWPRRSRM